MTACWQAAASRPPWHGYKQMLAWMRSFGSLQRVGVEATGPYGAGLLRYLQHAGVKVLEVTTPDPHDRRKRGKTDDLDAQTAAHAALAGRRSVTPKSRDGMIAFLRVLKACRKTAGTARRRAADDPQHPHLRARRAP
jgi:transposase